MGTLTAFKLLPCLGQHLGYFFDYQMKISPDCFVWAIPTVLTAGPTYNTALNS